MHFSAPAARKTVFADSFNLILLPRFSEFTNIKDNITKIMCVHWVGHDTKYKLSDPHNSKGRSKFTISLCQSFAWQPIFCIVYSVSKDRDNRPQSPLESPVAKVFLDFQETMVLCRPCFAAHDPKQPQTAQQRRPKHLELLFLPPFVCLAFSMTILELWISKLQFLNHKKQFK